MALVSSGFYLAVALKDTSGSTSTLRFQLQGADIATATTNAGIILPLLEACTLSNVSQYSVSQQFVENAFALPVGAENASKAEVNGLIAGEPNKTGQFRIPAPSVSIMVSPSGPGYNQVKLDSVNLEAFASIYEVGGQAFISDGENLGAIPGSLVSGKRVSVHSRNP